MQLLRIMKLILLPLVVCLAAIILLVAWRSINGDMGPVHRAAARGDCPRLERLLLKGRDPNVPASKFSMNLDNRFAELTPLHWAAEGDHPCAVRALIRQGADVDAQDRNGLTALQYAILYKRSSAAIELVRSGARLDVVNHFGATPMRQAFEFFLPEVAVELFRHGADMYTLDANSNRPLDYAIHTWNHHTDRLESALVSMLNDGLDPNATIVQDESILMYAVRRDMAEATRTALEHGADVDLRSPSMTTAWDLARYHNSGPNRDIIVRMLEQARQQDAPN